ncbi:MAG: MBL fold metallo-hydrolase [Pseudonocardia sp.]
MATGATFIGHQSWLVTIGDTHLLVDPVLTDAFGNSPHVRFRIEPARRVAPDRLPRIDAVVVSNEHLDHFHLPSLRALDRSVPVLVPVTMPTVCTDVLREDGFDVRPVTRDEEVTIGSAGVRLLAGPADVPVWESRVASVWIGRPGRPDTGVLVQSDTLLGPDAAAFSPEILLVTHNAQVPPPGHAGAFDNMLPLPPEQPAQTLGLSILHHVLDEALRAVGGARHVAFSGGGYAQEPARHGPFCWSDFAELADLANALSLHDAVVGLAPGERLTPGREPVVDAVDWILPPEQAGPDPADPRTVEFDELGPLVHRAVDDADRALIGVELAELAPLLLLSPLGRSLVNVHEYLGRPTGPLRCAVHLRGFGPEGDRVVALDVNTARFESTALSLRDALFTVPSGVDVWASDLAAVLRGELHVWELAVSRMRQWYVNDRLDSPVGFLYGCLSEQLRPDLAHRLYRPAVPC